MALAARLALVLAADADVNAAAAEPYGRTALQAAAERGHPEIVNELLAANADVNAAVAIHEFGLMVLQAAAGGGRSRFGVIEGG